MSKKKSNFRDKMMRSRENDKKRMSSFGYLDLPKGVSVLKVEDRKMMLDFLLYKVSDKNHPERDEEGGVALVGDGWWRRPFKVHKNVGPDNETVVCPTTFGLPCPICEEYHKMRQDEDADQDDVYALKAKSRYLYAVVPIGHKKLEEEVMIWDMSWSLFQKLLDDELEDDPDNMIFPDFEDGKTLDIRFSEESLGKAKWFEATRIKFLDREEAYEPDYIDEVPDLDAVLKVLSYKELSAKFYDYDPEDDDEDETFSDVEDDEEVEIKTKRKPKTTRKAKPKPEVEDDEEDVDDDTEDDDEEVVIPKRKTSSKKTTSKAKSKKKVVEDDDEESCPEGYVFGKDTEKYDECDDCDLYDACIEMKEDNE